MGDQRERESDKGERRSLTLGVAVAFGVALGTVIFAITGEAVWIAIGPSLGVVVGAAIGYRNE